MNVKLNGYICASHNLKLDVRIILSYNFTVIKKSTHRSMPTHILKIHTSKYATKKNPKTHTKNLLRHVFLNHTKILQNLHTHGRILQVHEHVNYSHLTLLLHSNSETMCTCQKVAKAFNQKFQQHRIGQTLNVSYRSWTFLIIYWTGLS